MAETGRLFSNGSCTCECWDGLVCFGSLVDRGLLALLPPPSRALIRVCKAQCLSFSLPRWGRGGPISCPCVDPSSPALLLCSYVCSSRLIRSDPEDPLIKLAHNHPPSIHIPTWGICHEKGNLKRCARILRSTASRTVIAAGDNIIRGIRLSNYFCSSSPDSYAQVTQVVLEAQCDFGEPAN